MSNNQSQKKGVKRGRIGRIREITDTSQFERSGFSGGTQSRRKSTTQTAFTQRPNSPGQDGKRLSGRRVPQQEYRTSRSTAKETANSSYGEKYNNMSSIRLANLRWMEPDQPPSEQELAGKVSVAIFRSFDRLLSQEKPVPTLFCELVNKLDKFFSICKASLVLHNPYTGTLALASWWDRYCFKEGVIISLPRENSLLYATLKSQSVVQEAINGKVPGNFVEQKLLISEETQTLAVCPAVFEDAVYGLVALASPVPGAFDMMQQGYFELVFDRFGELLAKKTPSDIWERIYRNESDMEMLATS